MPRQCAHCLAMTDLRCGRTPKAFPWGKVASERPDEGHKPSMFILYQAHFRWVQKGKTICASATSGAGAETVGLPRRRS